MKPDTFEHRLTSIESAQRSLLVASVVGGGTFIGSLWALASVFTMVIWRMGSRIGEQNGRVSELEQETLSHHQELRDRRPYERLDSVEEKVATIVTFRLQVMAFLLAVGILPDVVFIAHSLGVF